MRFFTLILLYCLSSLGASAQLTISGTVFDISKLNFVEHVKVMSTGGMYAYTDSMGRYSILVNENDSLSFVYTDKPTQKFAVKTIPNTSQFDISLRIPVKSRYQLLKEVVVYSKTYREDSLENRETYRDVFGYSKPGLSTSITPDGGVGADVDELINIFRFKRNKRLHKFQQRLEEQEQDKYVNFRFNKIFVKRVTGLDGNALDSFMRWYRPGYEFTANSSEIVFNQYVLNAFYQFKKLGFVPPAKKPDELN